jgi:hypothetical protein
MHAALYVLVFFINVHYNVVACYYIDGEKSRNNNEKKSRWHVKYASGVIGVLKSIRINNDKYMYIVYIIFLLAPAITTTGLKKKKKKRNGLRHNRIISR